jgi:hypothetical protein
MAVLIVAGPFFGLVPASAARKCQRRKAIGVRRQENIRALGGNRPSFSFPGDAVLSAVETSSPRGIEFAATDPSRGVTGFWADQLPVMAHTAAIGITLA